MKKDIILSGLRPTGRLHIGNYLGSLANFLKLQEKYECYFFIADLHSLNEPFSAEEKLNQIINLAIDYIALGLDPKKCTIFIQSHLSEHSELAVILSNFIPVGYLFRMTQFKEKSQDREAQTVNAGLLYYPVLMASDILLYKSTLVPVGQDQTQHVEFARDAAQFFNNKFGPTFPEPRPLYTESPKIMSLLHPDKKMSKTLGDNDCIYIDDDPDTIANKLARAVTDTGDGKSLGAQNLLFLSKIFCGPDEYQKFCDDMDKKQLKYSMLKEKLALSIAKYFAHFREKKAEFLQKPQKIQDMLLSGNQSAKKVAQKTLEEVKEKVGIQ